MDAKTTNKPSEPKPHSGTDMEHPFLEDDLERILEPPKKWRNKYCVLLDFIASDMGNRLFKKGEIFLGMNTWPSKDIAETKFYESLKVSPKTDVIIAGVAMYLGAFDVTNQE